MIDLTETTLAILAGGQSRRMGVPKASLQLDGKPILRYLLDGLQWPGPSLLVTAPGQEHPAGAELFDAEAVDPESLGPLGGVLTALNHAGPGQLVICTLDMPAVRRIHLSHLLSRLEARPDLLGLMLSHDTDADSRVEPFPFACRADARDPISRALASGERAMHSLINMPHFAAEAAPTDWPSEVWTNLNFPNDFERFRAEAEKIKGRT